MKTVIIMEELTEEITRSEYNKKLLPRLMWIKLREVSLAGERGIKDLMPKDTGRATASWGHWTAGDIRRVSTNSDFGPGDAIYRADQRALEIEQGSNVEYIEYLNEGHSQQRGAGFIDAIAEKAERELEAALNDLEDV